MLGEPMASAEHATLAPYAALQSWVCAEVKTWDVIRHLSKVLGSARVMDTAPRITHIWMTFHVSLEVIAACHVFKSIDRDIYARFAVCRYQSHTHSLHVAIATILRTYMVRRHQSSLNAAMLDVWAQVMRLNIAKWRVKDSCLRVCGIFFPII